MSDTARFRLTVLTVLGIISISIVILIIGDNIRDRNRLKFRQEHGCKAMGSVNGRTYYKCEDGTPYSESD